MDPYIWMHQDFTIPIMVWTLHGWEISLKESSLVPDSSFISKIVCHLFNGSSRASGTVISVRDQPIFVGGESVRHLLLTAGHCVGNKFSSNRIDNSSSVHFDFDNRPTRSYLAQTLFDFSNWTAQPLLDSQTGYAYPLSDDLAI